MLVYQYADLHLHTCHSDGSFTPGELLELAVEKGFAAVSITDHDTICGYLEARPLAAEMGIELISGIELSCMHKGQELHILGYCIDPENAPLIGKIRQMRDFRLQRAEKITGALNGLGVKITMEQVMKRAGRGAVGRLHVAMELLESGAVKNIPEAFFRYLGNNGPACFPKYELSPVEAMELINSAGGTSVIAHPMTVDNFEGMLPELIEMGLEGIEVFYPDLSEEKTELFYDLAATNQLLITGGSDCHGRNKKEILMGKVRLPIDYVRRLQNYNSYKQP